MTTRLLPPQSVMKSGHHSTPPVAKVEERRENAPMQRLKHYLDPKLFWNEVSPHLRGDEAKNSMMLGVSYLYQTHPTDCLYQSALFTGGQLTGALVCSRYQSNCNLIIAPVTHPDHAATLFHEFQKSKIRITGIMGDSPSVKLYEPLFNSSGKLTPVKMAQGIYKCNKVILPPESQKLNFRPANLTDLKTVAEWIESFYHESGFNEGPVNALEFAETKIKNSMIFVIELNGELLSMAAWSRDIGTSCSVNFVFTPTHLRKRGYASLVTSKLTQHLLKSGKRETNLYTDITNPTSNKIYQNIGYQFVCNSVLLAVKES